MKNELQVKINQKLGIIDFNYEEMKLKLSEKMKQYSDIVVTTDTKAIAKKDVAGLRKLKKELNDRRIGVKKEYDKPYDEFKAKVDKLTGLIDDPIELIDSQVKDLEEREKAEKKEKIKEIYEDLIGDIKDYLPLQKIYDKKWENISTSLKSIKEEMADSISSVAMSIETIKGMSSEVEDKALELFKDDLSLANAITYINKHEQRKAEILAKEQARRKEEDERKRREEDERIKAEERRRVIEEERIKEEAKKQAIEEERQRVEEEKRQAEESKVEEVEEVKEEVEAVEAVEGIETLEEAFELEEPFDMKEDECLPFLLPVKTTFDVFGTEEEIEKVEDYLKTLNLDYERTDY